MLRVHRLLSVLGLLLAAALPAGAQPELKSEAGPEAIYGTWRSALDHLLSDAEKGAWKGLSTDAEREIFLRGFWRSRAAAPPSTTASVSPAGPAENLERFHLKLEQARASFESLEEDRARAVLVAGGPSRSLTVAGCEGVLRQLEVWVYEPWQIAYQGAEAPAGDVYLIFYLASDPDKGVYRQWDPAGGVAALLRGTSVQEVWEAEDLLSFATAKRCYRWEPGAAGVLPAALESALGPEGLRELLVPEPPDAAWLGQLRAGEAPAASLELLFPGLYRGYTVLQGRITLPLEEVGHNGDGKLFDRFEIDGQLWRPAQRPDAFRVVHHVAGSEPEGATLALDFFRLVKPGPYTLSLRVADAHGLGLLREERSFEVPEAEADAAPPPGYAKDFGFLTKKDTGVMTTFPSVELLPPGDGLLVGPVEVEAVTGGAGIERVEFLLDGRPAGRDDEPPYLAVLALGDAPRPHTVEALGFDSAGRRLARDEIRLDGGPSRFAVRLLAPGLDAPAGRLEALVDVPADESLESVQLYLGQRKVATLHEAPFGYTLPPEDSLAVFARAVATLEGGETAEDLVFLNASTPHTEVDVQLVQLFVSVLDKRGRPVGDLAGEDFAVYEDARRMTVQRFDRVESLPVSVALLLDTSGSMGRRLKVSAASARRFFETVLGPEDRASVVTFNHDIRQRVPFTGDIDRLRFGTGGVAAYGSTRLYDSLAYTIHSFGGSSGRRALILLSDGEDVGSDLSFEHVLDLTLRSGITVYPIALDLGDEETRERLEHLAEETGGTYHSISRVEELEAVYAKIEEDLRSQYLLVYQSPQERRRGQLRQVEVHVTRKGLRARHLRGYYP